MAPAATLTPGRKRRENVFFQPGIQGRKTGVTIKDTGRRDEHGFEPLDAIFSSPEKSPPKRPVRAGQGSSSESMDIQLSSALEPIDVLSARRSSKSKRVSLPPPRARSPIKTNLNSSPQRHPSLAPNSAARQSLGSPIRPAQLASVKRRIDFNQDIPAQSIEFSPRKPQRGGRSSDAENVPPSDERLDVPAGAEFDPPTAESYEVAEDTYIPIIDDDSIQILEVEDGEQVPASTNSREDAPAVPSKSKRKSLANGLLTATPSSVSSLKRKRGQPARKSSEALDTHKDVAQTPSKLERVTAHTYEHMDDTMSGALPPSDAEAEDAMPVDSYSSPLKTVMEVHRDTTVDKSEDSADEYQDKRPGKKSRRSSGKATTMKKKSIGTAKNSRMPKERDPNVAVTSKKRSGSKAPSEDGDAAPARGSRAPSKPRSLQILRQGTPLEEPGATKTRSGRQSIQPVAWWCGERINRDFDGTITDVIRAETVDLTPKRRGRPPTAKNKKHGLGSIREEEDDEDDDAQPEIWEEDGGILTGLVKAWDSEYNMTVEDDDIEMEVAFASNSIQTRDVMGANFSYAKLLTLPFFGAGVVDLPPGGFKRAKNSRKMQMVFFVHTGKVLVTVGDLEFSISKGGAWQVPRGNFYSIENRGAKPSRIFFSQGNEHIPGEGAERD